MFKQWLKQFIAVCICLITILSPLASYLTPTTAYAEDYVLVDDEDDTNGADYFIVEGEDFEKLFDFGLSEVDDIVRGAIDSLTTDKRDSYRLEINDLDYEYLIIALTVIIDMNYNN